MTVNRIVVTDLGKTNIYLQNVLCRGSMCDISIPICSVTRVILSAFRRIYNVSAKLHKFVDILFLSIYADSLIFDVSFVFHFHSYILLS